MNRENKIFIILTLIGAGNLIAAFILAFTVEDPMVPMVLLASGVFLIIGGVADKKERQKRRKRDQ
ncbi:hypothetical protein EQV77_14085 [Halobacillus fulvus]|nr:hypothetical protein EQV77_14085 [Halobacillus fulvus]